MKRNIILAILICIAPLLLSAQTKKAPEETNIYKRLDRIVQLSTAQSQQVIDIITQQQMTDYEQQYERRMLRRIEKLKSS